MDVAVGDHVRLSLLPEVGELVAGDDDARRVPDVGQQLERRVEQDGERVARPVGVVAGGDARRHVGVALHLDGGAVVGGAVARAIEPQAGEEDAPVDGELDAVAAAAVAPLVAAVGGGEEAAAVREREAAARAARERHRRAARGAQVEEDVVRLLQRQDARLRRPVGELAHAHRGQPQQVEGVAERRALPGGRGGAAATRALRRRPAQRRLEHRRLGGVERVAAEHGHERRRVHLAEAGRRQRRYRLRVHHLGENK